MESYRVTPDNFASKVKKLIEEYGDDVFDAAEDAAKVAARATVKDLKATKHVRPGGGRYARGWTSKWEAKGTVNFAVYVYNRDVPGLPHLLNNTHAVGRHRGGVYHGDGHIDTAERHGIDIFLKGVETRL